MAVDPAWIALIGTLCGGAGLKVAEHWLGRNKVKVDEAVRIRDELRLEITAQREEIKLLEAEVNEWREKYYALLQKHMALETELTLAVDKIKNEALHAVEVVKEISESPPETPPIDPGAKS